MGLVTFTLTHKNDFSGTPVKSSNKLLDIYNHIRTEVNDSRNWTVNEIEDNEEVDFCSDFYMLENFTQDTLPKTISDIKHL